MVRTTGVIALATLALAACDDGTGLEETGRVEIRFEAARADGQAGVSRSGSAGRVPVFGSNGTLEIESAHMIVSEVELERFEDACPDDDAPAPDGGDDCEDFEVDPFLLELPLDGGVVTVAASDVGVGTYSAFEFEVDDLEDDEEDDDAAALEAVLAEARLLHDDWPREGSLVVEGTFTPEGSTEARPFRTFVEAEVEIESTFPTPLEVAAGGDAAVTVVLDPRMWFTRGDGTVLDLSLFDYTGDDDDLLELEVELEEGVIRVEVESG